MQREIRDQKSGDGEKKTILIIEDDPFILSSFIEYLKYLGYNVISAMDGLEGLKHLESGDFDLVITDIVIPYVSGVGIVSALKEKKPDTPIIAMTGYGKEPEAAAQEKEADVVLAKPIYLATLKEHISKLI